MLAESMRSIDTSSRNESFVQARPDRRGRHFMYFAAKTWHCRGVLCRVWHVDHGAVVARCVETKFRCAPVKEGRRIFLGRIMSTAPHVDIDVSAFWNDPYPVLATLRRDAPIAFIPQLGATVSGNARRHLRLGKADRRIQLASTRGPNEPADGSQPDAQRRR